MKQLRHVLRLYVNGQSKRSIRAKVHLSRNTIRKYVRLFQELRLTSDDLQELSDLELSKLFTSHVAQELNPRLAVLKKFYPYVDRELRKVGVTKSLLWEEYLQKYPDGYRFTQFCKYYTQWKRRVDPTVHIDYKAGDKMLVDYAGKKLQVIDRASGELISVEVFVATLGCSHQTFVEATVSQKKEDFISSCERSLRFFRGVPKAIVTDNLKSAVTKSDRFEPVLNEDFQDFADHY
ncbi:MAG: IS21 family transposase [Flavobacteriales bacterium]|nr:IS21 family transposase [Flavobacteriales bacterium]